MPTIYDSEDKLNRRVRTRDDDLNPALSPTYFVLPAAEIEKLRGTAPAFFGRLNAEDQARHMAQMNGQPAVVLRYVSEAKTVTLPPAPPPPKFLAIVRIDE